VLEDLSQLFRVALAEVGASVTLAEEIDLAKRYLAIEQVRFGDRLAVDWEVDAAASSARVPPLVLQPLVENAVYHGIEPSAGTGVVSIDAYRSRNEVHLVLRNPYRKNGSHHSGNKMAVSNIRERLALHFDAEASLRTNATEDAYQVHIVMPYRSQT
jgi:two-component system sensor histidine kinase AlgZ